MAFKARVDGVLTDAASFSTEAWAELALKVRSRESTVIMPFCLHTGHGSVSVGNLHFFKHYSADSACVYNTAPESAQHRFAKHEVAAGARAAGAVVRVERSSPRGTKARWRADVMAEFDGKRWAIEVQKSHQATADYIARTARYRVSAVRSLWFILDDTAGHERLDDLVDAYRARVGFDTADVIGLGDAGDHEVPLQEFVRRWVLGHRPTMPPKRPRAPVTPSPDEGSIFGTESGEAGSRHARAVDDDYRHQLPQRECPFGCNPGMSYSSYYEVWICLTCSRTMQPPEGVPLPPKPSRPARAPDHPRAAI